MKGPPLALVLAALERVNGQRPRRSGREWAARCPVHDDRHPSLSISEGDDGRALVYCHGGCPTESITQALGLTLRDLMPVQPSPSPKPPTERARAGFGDGDTRKTFETAGAAITELERRHGARSAFWIYHDAAGEPISVVIRWNRDNGRKDIRPVSRTPRGWIIGAMPKPRPLYDLPTIASAKRVFVCEGEPACDALRALGLTTTTSSGGSNAARQSDWSPLTSCEVVVLPDADRPGRRYAETVVELLRGRAATIKRVDLPDLPAHGDAVDFVASRRASGLDDEEIRGDVERMADEAAAIESEQPAMDVFQPFPVDSLPDRLRTFVVAVAASTGTEPAFAALAVLVMVAGCVGNRVAALVKSGWIEPAVLWGVLVGRSGTTKSPVLKSVLRPLYEVYKAERRVFAEAMHEYQQELEHHKVRLIEWKRTQKDGPPTDPPEEPQRPLEKRGVVSDTTSEKLGCLLEENTLGLMLVRDELAAWIGGFDRYAAGGKGSDCPAWLSMFDAAPITIDRKNAANTIFIERAAVSVLGSIQPGTLARVFGTAEREAGLLARVLLTYPPDQPALWTEAELPDHVVESWGDLLRALLAIEPVREDAGDVRPRLLPFDPKAKSLWIAWHDRHARESVEIGNDDLAAHFAKLKGICARIALLFTCVDVASGGGGVASIGADAMRSAIAVVEWFKREGRRAYAMLSETDTECERRRLREWIERRGGSATVRDLTHGLRKYRGDSEAAEAALGALVEAGLGRWTHPTPNEKGGRPPVRFELTDSVTATETRSGDTASRGFGDGNTGDVSSNSSGGEGSDVGNDGDWGRI